MWLSLPTHPSLGRPSVGRQEGIFGHQCDLFLSLTSPLLGVSSMKFLTISSVIHYINVLILLYNDNFGGLTVSFKNKPLDCKLISKYKAKVLRDER